MLDSTLFWQDGKLRQPLDDELQELASLAKDGLLLRFDSAGILQAQRPAFSAANGKVETA